MDSTLYGTINQAVTFLQAIPQSSSGDTVTVDIRKQSNGYYWNFSTTAFQVGSASGSMTYQSGEWWRQSFTPDAAGIYLITVNNSTLDVKYYITVIVGGVTVSGTSGSYLTTLANVKSYLNITDTNSDTIITALIPRITDLIQSFCNRIFGAADYVEFHNGDSQKELFLKNYPVNSVASIYDDPDRTFDSLSLIAATDYAVESLTGIVYLDIQLSEGRQSVKVAYNGGYATIPSDLEHAAILMITAEFLDSRTDVNTPDGVSEKERRTDSVRKQAKEIYEKYRRIPNG